MTIGTAGHIDHGKSALVQTLTGVHPDRLAEEKRRGITLDLGFGHWAQDGETIGIVDVPGHERFVRTMLAGAGGIDVMLLVVAADAGVQPQTVEHLAICRLLGIRQGVVAIAKCDLADKDQIAAVRRQIAELVAGTQFAQAPVMEVSALAHAGIEELRQALVAAGRQASARDAAAPFRLPIDRAFTMKGFGAIVTGTLVQGTLHSGSEVELAPAGKRVRVRGLQVHGQAKNEVTAGQRVAVNLAGVEWQALHRGQELVEPGSFPTTRVLDVELNWIAGVPRLPHRARCRLHLHTAETIATLLWLAAPSTRPGWAQLRLEDAIVAAPGDRFILRQLSPAVTLGGGTIRDAEPPLHRRADYPAAAALLCQLAATPDLAARVQLWLERAGTQGCELAALSRRTGERLATVEQALTHAACVRSDHPAAALALSALAPIERDLLAALAAFHRSEGERMDEGAALDALGLPYPAHWIAAAAASLLQQGKLEAAAGGRFRLPGAAPARSAAQQQLRGTLEDYFRSAGWAAPLLKQALERFPQPGARALIAELTRERVLIECQPGWFLHATALDRLRALLAEHKAQQPQFSVNEFKQWTGLTRKLAIPLLEYCDRTRLTRRSGDHRLIL